MIFISCSEDDITTKESNVNTDNGDDGGNEDDNDTKETIEIIASSILGETTNSRVIYEDLGDKIIYKWEDTDKITVCFKHEYDGIYNEWKDFSIKSINDKIAEFTGEFTEGELINFPSEEWKYMWALSPAAPRLEESHWSTSILCSAKEQEVIDGKTTLKAAYLTARAEYKKGETVDFKFYPRMAAVCFNVFLPDDYNAQDLKGVTISGKGIYSDRVLNLEAPRDPYFEWKQGTEGDINVSFSGSLPIDNQRCLSFLIFMFPNEDIENINLSLIDEGSRKYKTEIKFMQTLEAGKRYATNVRFKDGISAEIESKNLSIASLFDSEGKFISRYDIDLDNNLINVLFFNGSSLNRVKKNITVNDNEISFDGISIDGIVFNGLRYENQEIIPLGTGLDECSLKSQKNIIDILAESNDMEWKTEVDMANDYGHRTDSGDASDNLVSEYNNNLYIEWIQFQSKRKRLYSSGIRAHGDIVFNNECESLNDLLLNGCDVIKFSMNNNIYSYGCNGEFPGFTTEENKKVEAPFMYMKKTMPKFVETWSSEQGLIVIQEKTDNNTFFYFISTNSNEWIKFKVLE